MKFRLNTIIVLLSLTLAACSLAEDITPPPGYQSPTPAPSLDSATRTPPPTLTSEPATATSEPTVINTDQGTSSAEGSVTPAASVVMVKGKVTNFSGASLSGALTASLYLYNSTLGNVDQSLTAPVQADGTYQFLEVPADTAITYFVTVDFGGVTYTSSPATYSETVASYDLPVIIYDVTDNMDVLTISQVHMSYDFSVDGKAQVQILYVISNPGTKSVLVTSDGSSIPFIQIPADATDVKYSLAQGSAPLMNATNGFALIPGADKQYGILAQFTLPYTRSLKMVQPFSLPVSAVTVIVPEGVRVQSKQVKDSGTQDYQGQTYHLYQGDNLASGGTLSLTISGKPGSTTIGFSLNRQTILLIGIGVVGILLIGLGVYLYLRERALSSEEEEGKEEEVEGDALGDDRESIMDAIIALDDQYKAGAISQEAYEKRRAELKERLQSTA